MKRIDPRKTLWRFTYFYVLAFGALSYFTNNKEFFYYSIIFLISLLIIRFYQRRYHVQVQLPTTILTGFVIAGFMHMLGGFVYIGGVKLYDINFWIFGYDNFVHAFSAFVFSFAAYNLLKPYLDKKLKENGVYLSLLLALIALGMGSIVEIVEFAAVVFLGATGVGDYTNNALDIVFNTLGAIIGCTSLVWYHKRKEKE